MHIVTYAACVLASLTGLWGVLHIFPASPFGPYSFVYVLLFGLILYGAIRFLRIKDRRAQGLVLPLGFFFCLSTALGYQMQRLGGLGQWPDMAAVLCAGIGLGPLASFLLWGLYQACCRLRRLPAHADRSPRAAFWLYTAGLFLCWLPVFLAYYPGLFNYDVHVQLRQVLDGAYSANHPLLHTWFMGLFYRLGGLLGSYTLGIALHSLFQMAAMCLCLAWMLAYLYRIQVPQAVRVAGFLFFALCPIHPMLAISTTKDVLYSAFLVLSAISLHQAYRDPSQLKDWKFFLRLLILIALTCLLRNNGVLVFLPLALLLLFFVRKHPAFCLRMIALLASGMLLFAGCSFGLSKAFQAEPGKIKEALSVPLQQLARVYNRYPNEVIYTTELEEYMPRITAYSPTFADPIKTHADIDPDYISDFIDIWWELGQEYPQDYWEAFLFNCQGYWFVDDTTQATHYGTALEDRQGYLLSDIKKGFQIAHVSLFPGLESLYERLFSANEYLDIPILAQLFSLAGYSWMLMFLLFTAVYERRKDILWSSAPLVLTLLFLLFSPCAIVRYQYPLILACPVLFGLFLGCSACKSLNESI